MSAPHATFCPHISTMATSACDIVRDALSKAGQCACDGSEASKALAQCTVDGKLLAGPPAACSVFNLAGRRDLYFKTQYSPADLLAGDATVRQKVLANIGASIDQNRAAVLAAYGPDAPVDDITYWRMQRCLASKDGRAGAFGNTYIDRQTLQAQASYAPQPVIGGRLLEGRVPPALTRLLPVAADRIMNPSLMMAVILIIVLAVLWVLVLKVRKGHGDAYAAGVRARVAAEEKANLDNPFGYLGSPYVVDKKDEAREKVLEYEARGYDMSAYREKLGMPPRA